MQILFEPVNNALCCINPLLFLPYFAFRQVLDLIIESVVVSLSYYIIPFVESFVSVFP